MTREEYATYQTKVARFFEQEGINCLNGDGEAYFSKIPCDCCSRPLAGLREGATGYNPTAKEVLSYEVCLDCLNYAAYGQLDDTTMLDMEKGEL